MIDLYSTFCPICANMDGVVGGTGLACAHVRGPEAGFASPVDVTPTGNYAGQYHIDRNGDAVAGLLL
jgi:hypothetical protein